MTEILVKLTDSGPCLQSGKHCICAAPVRSVLHTLPMSRMPAKDLTKLWVEKQQLDRFKVLSKRAKLSVAWLSG